MELRKSIKAVIENKEDILKKNITITLNSDMIRELDIISKQITELNGSKAISRNFLIESAISNYLVEAKAVLKEDYDISIEDLKLDDEVDVNDVSKVIDFDTVIFPGHNDGFEETFIGEHCWYPVRIHDEKISKLKYVAVYRAAPISAITHYAKIDSFERYEDTKKRIIYFEGNAIELPKPVKLGESEAASMRSPRYTTLEKLLSSNEVKDLF